MLRTVLNGVVGEISDLPGCPQIAVSHYVFLREGQKGKGQGQRAHRDRLQLMKEAGYDYALCTVIGQNAVERHILEKHGWKPLDSFSSTKTQNSVELWGKPLKDYVVDRLALENETYDEWERSISR